jgi:hypothetical protein
VNLLKQEGQQDGPPKIPGTQEGSMTNKKMYVMLSISALVVALAVPLMAQSMQLTANIPFEFAIGTKTLPAGVYDVRTDSNPYLLVVQGQDRRSCALSMSNREYLQVSRDPAAQTRLVFNHYGNRYFLSEVRNGFSGTGFVIHMSRAERELAQTASAQRLEVLATMARR